MSSENSSNDSHDESKKRKSAKTNLKVEESPNKIEKRFEDMGCAASSSFSVSNIEAPKSEDVPICFQLSETSSAAQPSPSADIITLFVHFNNDTFNYSISKRTTVKGIKVYLKRHLKLPLATPLEKIEISFAKKSTDKKIPLNDPHMKLEEVGIYNNDIIHITTVEENKTGKLDTNNESSAHKSKEELRKGKTISTELNESSKAMPNRYVPKEEKEEPSIFSSTAVNIAGKISKSSAKHTSVTTTEAYKPSLTTNSKQRVPCGLDNIGNTCFMNSALQCIIHVKDLTKYFLEGNYVKDLNRTNPLGMDGDVAEAYAELIRGIFSGNQSSFTPSKLKRQVARHAPQFADFGQHDSQEFMNFLLDALHEDLKKEEKKPFGISKVSQLFHIEIQSTVTCSQCNIPVVTTYAACFLPLPIQKITSSVTAPNASQTESSALKSSIYQNNKNEIDVTLVHVNGLIGESRKFVSSSPHDTIKDLFRLFINDSKDYDRYLPVLVEDDQIEEKLDNQVLLKTLTSQKQIVLYELTHKTTDKNKKLIQCSFAIMDKNKVYFRLPMYLSILKKHYELNDIKEKLEIVLCDVLELNELKFEKIYAKNDATETDQTVSDVSLVWNNKTKRNKLIEVQFNNHAGTKLTIHVVDTLIPAVHLSKLSTSQIPKYDLQRSISSTIENLTLEKCIEEFLAPETLGANGQWFCSDCQELTNAKKKLDLISLPKYLILQLKRFNFDRTSNNKIDTLVQFPLSDLDLSHFIFNAKAKTKMKYDLIAVSNHSGSLVSGHYTAYGKNFLDGRWYNFNDSNVDFVVDETRIISRNAYLLVYAQKT